MLESFVGELQYKKLSPQEMKSRGILGRLVGPMADTLNGTRNDRKYSKELWEQAINSDIFQEKLNNKCVLSELGHPADRTETLISEACAALAEQPKIGKDGKLYGVWDILDTPNGRILKTLCDYGTKIGISSRGEGDIIEGYDGESKVDPETYSLETWDMVLLPAVKEARMNYVTEALDKKRYNKTLRQKLSEELDKASTDDRELMNKTLKNLDITLEEEKVDEYVEPSKHTAALKALYNAIDDPEDKEGIQHYLQSMLETIREMAKDYEVDLVDEVDEQCEEDLIEAIRKKETPDVDIVYQDKIVKAYIENDDEMHSALIDSCYDAIQDAGVEKMTFHVAYDDNVEEWYIAEEEIREEVQTECNTTNECADKEAAVEETEANDDGSDEILEQLQETLKLNSQLKKQVENLQNKLAVSDTEATKVNEELAHYRAATASLSEKARQARSLEKKVTTLNEKLQAQEKEHKAVASQQLKEAVKQSSRQLREDKVKAEKEIQSLNEKLEEAKVNAELKRSEYNKTITKAKSLIKEYKTLANDTVNRYIESKATMLGVSANEIKNRLNESYTIDDIDKVCDDLQSYQVNISKLPFAIDKSKVRVTESKREALRSQSPFDDEIDEDLLALAKIHF